ncbi:hypothetical protein LEP1GSC127_4854 [Leptospira kirschneri str. 200801925]|uniref:Uncharacterized protein n=1 Tax=Leptospira kirschneri str. 200802841 TaxID=1193047 RepID=A0A828Y3U8_9LEPT|nr:hypothetical protein LEP1GSC044_3751 [Leptospira kirschneri serovar Grippotyphosa str. RM52]EKO52423.1 hypothetical protein LEP1GSC131_1595 [Leptospira kirschneri str. 200802841]EKQ84469.1 hypothetical protein LEP1GSC064_1399 [Leptospira kirschneri serovar Grippotyphosa str. Moskva]EKR09105.1 hypothetical protein LEP1GSC122_0507 [Leptospira kirschneri serovar Valbuzzi str. 200702274]EMO76979.1 hypothetical protein LEP1GSC127_4854 [Leptospira kirschneri str. 200801925]OOV49410.1 hypothetical
MENSFFNNYILDWLQFVLSLLLKKRKNVVVIYKYVDPIVSIHSPFKEEKEPNFSERFRVCN